MLSLHRVECLWLCVKARQINCTELVAKGNQLNHLAEACHRSFQSSNAEITVPRSPPISQWALAIIHDKSPINIWVRGGVGHERCGLR